MLYNWGKKSTTTTTTMVNQKQTHHSKTPPSQTKSRPTTGRVFSIYQLVTIGFLIAINHNSLTVFFFPTGSGVRASLRASQLIHFAVQSKTSYPHQD